jgi:pimeloyl-ACP methyl ester carboxylesterase
MAIDVEFVGAHRRIDRADAGIAESFEDLAPGGPRSVATLYRPLRPADAARTGWVICHSFGLEQTTLMEHEVATARSVAAAGMPVLRYQGRGYGDAEGAAADVGLDTHVEDAGAAVARLAALAGVDRIGVIGGRFGGMVAALTAERVGLPLMVLWEPTVSGARLMRDLVRSAAIRDMARDLRRSRRHRAGRSAYHLPEDDEDPATALRTRGRADIGGFVITERARRAIAAVDLRSDVERFGGEALIVHLAAASRPAASSSDTVSLVGHMRSQGVACDETVIVDEHGGNFGRIHHGTVGDGRPKRDLQAPLASKLAAVTAAWCLRHAVPPTVAPSTVRAEAGR